MKTLNRVLPFATKVFLKITLITVFLMMAINCSDDKSHTKKDEPGNANQTSYGTPNKITIAQKHKDEVNISFGIIADTHVDATTTDYGWWPLFDPDTFGYNDSDRMNHNRDTISVVNTNCKTYDCLGIVHLGDMVEQSKNDYATQQVVAFRQFYENDYPGHDGGAVRDCFPDKSDGCQDAYSEGHRINFPVFPTLGNHDASNPDWHKPLDYLGERIGGASGIVSRYDHASYIWRWGSYYFIQLGLWAGSGTTQNASYIDQKKLDWLKSFLEKRANDNAVGLLIFQHYGWDDFSTDGWWSEKQRNLELDILCRREDDQQPCRPYNVLGIFTGHAHLWKVIPIPDTYDNQVYFTDFVIPDAGRDDNKQKGFSVVQLDGEKMTIKTMNRHDHTWWPTFEQPITIGPRTPDSFWYTIGYDIQSNGDPADGSDGWGPIVYLPYSDSIPAGGGADITDINGKGAPDIILM